MMKRFSNSLTILHDGEILKKSKFIPNLMKVVGDLSKIRLLHCE